MKPEDKIKELINKSDVTTTTEIDNKILAGASEHLEQLRQKNLAAGDTGVLRVIMKRSVVRLAAAAVIVVAAVIGIYQISSPGIAWADVAERFRSVSFFSAAIYIKEDTTSEAKQIELWMNESGQVRLRTGNQVVFGNRGEVIRAYDVKERKSVEAEESAAFLVGRLGAAEELSLDAVVKVVFGGQIEDVTPLVNPNAAISEDIVVFDIQSEISPEWLRIWALRESRLPISIRIWDPRDGGTTDVIFAYSKEQSDDYFDPNSFEQLILSRQAISRTNFAYAFLKDPGGKQITPEDIFEQSGCHMPIVTHAGITPQGAVWVIADRGANQTSNGYSFYGFSQIDDDLGREYRRVYATHRTATDQSMDVFVPLDYPFDIRIPQKITLTCRNDHHPDIEQDVIGTVDLKEWQQGQLWPEGTINSSEQRLAITLARRHCNAQRYDMAERILDTIPGKPEDSPAALTREEIRSQIRTERNKRR